MGFLRQLTLLLWKNFSLRKRQRLRNVIEILWPLALFFILIAVRKRRPPENKPTSYYKPRALPSAGALPFLQSFVCDFANPKLTTEQQLPNFSNTSFYRLVMDLGPIAQNRTELELIQRLPRDFQEFTNTLRELELFNRTAVRRDASLSDLLNDQTTVKDFILKHTTLNVTYVDAILNSKINLTKALETYSDLSGFLNPVSILTLPSKLQGTLCGTPGVRGFLILPKNINAKVIQDQLCKFTTQEWFELGTDIYRSINMTALRNTLQNGSNIDRYLETWRMFLSESRRLTQDLNELRSLERALGDLNLARNAMNGNTTTSLNFRSIVCGDRLNPTQASRNQRQGTDTYTVLRQQAQKTADDKEKKGDTPGTCSSLKKDKRIRCGWSYTSKGTCESMGCCFDETVKSNKCFCKPGHQRCCVAFNQFVALLSGLSGSWSDGLAKFATILLKGKVFYTPDTPQTREVIRKVNSFITQIDQSLTSALRLTGPLNALINFTNILEQNQDTYRRLLTKENLLPILQFSSSQFSTLTNWNQLIRLLNETEYEFDDLLRLKNQTETLSYLLDLVGSVAQCFNFSELFVPYPNEKEVVKRATDQSPGKPPFLSSIVFLNLAQPDGKFPKKVEYKLRLNPDYTPGTDRIRARYYRPGPGPYGREGFSTYRYINFGFVFLQDLIDRALMEILTNKTIPEPGIYTQQFPYPCWIRDLYYRPGPGPYGHDGFWQYAYLNFGFVFLQDLIDRALMEILTNRTIPEPGIYTQQFPYPCWIRDQFTNVISNAMPLFMVLAWNYSVAMIIKSIVYEKERRLKEVMKVMGLSNAVHWTAWFITSMSMMLISIIFMVIAMKFGKILPYSDPTVILWMLVSFATATIKMCFLISVFFSKANIAAACGGIIYFFTYLPYSLTIWFEDQMNYSHKALASLVSTTAFGQACRYISRWEEQGVGAQWSNYYKSPMPNDTYSLGMTCNMMLIDALIYFILMWYFENIMPGEYGIPRPWYFPFTKSYWIPKKHDNRDYVVEFDGRSTSPVVEMEMDNPVEQNGNPVVADGLARVNFEAEPNLPVGVNIQNLVKVYKRGNKKAVDGLSLKLFEGQVTSLLGHNGAGKSTTMSILTGLFPPTAGTAVVYGNDIRTDIDSVRKSIGICPQHNVLFDELTVGEHMWFYGLLKGMSGSDIKREITKFLMDVGLPEKKDEMSKNLSGGMKRKLSVALAFISDSRTVILDEPTAGVDPYSRRSIWDLILKYKKGRTILLSTHYMDEADLLGDRISIISNGKLQCSGTPLFLKRRFGEGYYLTVVKDAKSLETFDEDNLTKLIASYIPGSVLKEHVGSELCYILPSEARQTGAFEDMFRNLEKNFENLCVATYGISDTTLEEVFLKACNEDDSAFDDDDTISMTGPLQRRKRSVHPSADNISLSSTWSDTKGLLQSQLSINESVTDEVYSNKKRGLQLWLQQFVALLIKRFHRARRSRKGFFSQILLPAIFVVASMVVSLLRPPRTAMPSLKLTPSQYGRPDYAFVANLQSGTELPDTLTNAFARRPGIGADCVKPASCSRIRYRYPFEPRSKAWKDTGAKLPECSCSKGKQICPKGAAGPKPPQRKLGSGDVLIDITGRRNISNYLLWTTDDYLQRRYGGATFGDISTYLPDINVSAFSLDSLVSATGVRQNARVWYNNKGYHALPTYLNVMNNAILRANLDLKEDPADYGIVTYNHPMDYNKEQLSEETLLQGFTDLFVAIFVIVALSFVPSSFVVYLVSDRISKSKHSQMVSGLHPVIYWLANYTWDMINYLIPAFCCIIIFLCFNQKSYVSSDNFPVTMLLLILYGWSITPLVYPASFVFQVPSTAYIALICVNVFVGVIGTISTFILEWFQDDAELQAINGYLKQIFLIFPNYCLGRGLMDLARNQFESDIYSAFGEKRFKDPFGWTITGRNLFAMFTGGFIFMGITLLIQYKFFWKSRKEKPVNSFDEEEDVREERQRIQSVESQESDILRTMDLSKVYKKRFSKRKTLAVNRLSFGVSKGECFGLLGVNGAGKTSTFKMLTGDTPVSAGDAFIGGNSILRDMNAAHQMMGYCPQFDALDELLTARELLFYYARIRGLQKRYVPMVADWAINMLGLTPYANRIAGDYSGGNKRKLSTAVALLGNPPLVFLDEPTTGMDPGARRFLWDLISDIVKQERSVVLTSHSMEECESLCTRIAIMVNGQFMCLGSPQHLRSKYGESYTLIIRARFNEIDNITNFMEANFPNTKVKDQHHNMLEYEIPSKNLLLSQAFAKMEVLRKTNAIYDYSLSQTTLDQRLFRALSLMFDLYEEFVAREERLFRDMSQRDVDKTFPGNRKIFVNFARKQTEGVEISDAEIQQDLDDATTSQTFA